MIRRLFLFNEMSKRNTSRSIKPGIQPGEDRFRLNGCNRNSRLARNGAPYKKVKKGVTVGCTCPEAPKGTTSTNPIHYFHQQRQYQPSPDLLGQTIVLLAFDLTGRSTHFPKIIILKPVKVLSHGIRQGAARRLRLGL